MPASKDLACACECKNLRRALIDRTREILDYYGPSYNAPVVVAAVDSIMENVSYGVCHSCAQADAIDAAYNRQRDLEMGI